MSFVEDAMKQKVKKISTASIFLHCHYDKLWIKCIYLDSV